MHDRKGRTSGPHRQHADEWTTAALAAVPSANVIPAGVAGHGDESGAGRRPLAIQQSVEKVIGPFTFRPGAFTQVTFAPHAQPFQHSSRGRISCVAASRDPVLAPPLKQVTEQAACRLRRMAMALVPGSDGEADLGLAKVVRVRPGGAVTD